jgi:hypothetical protein
MELSGKCILLYSSVLQNVKNVPFTCEVALAYRESITTQSWLALAEF